ncbi:MAG TPA: caspase family protein [Chitinivibrionales bacterium]|nr:caspase family protein [Chitinivibrionales bacterium]
MPKHSLLLIILLASSFLAFGERYALLVGNSTASGNYAELKYVQNDLAALSDILIDFCGFAKEHLVILYNQTPQDFERALGDFSERMSGSKGNMFLLYYSGHADVANLKMGSGDYPLRTLKDKLTAFPADIRIGIFDACQSGSFTRIKGGRLDEPFLFRDDAKTKGQVILCSSSIDENAQESDRYGNSVFTFHFVNALRGSGDMAGDGRVTLGEAYQYAYNHTISSTAGTSGGVQHPSYQFRIQGEGDIVLADLNIRTRGILLSGDVAGDITILSDKGIVVADLAKKANTGVMIALKQGAYQVINGRGEQRFIARVKVDEKSVVAVKNADFSPDEQAAANKKGEETRRGAQIGITLSGEYGMYNFTGLSSALAQRFAGFNAFSMSPGFAFPKYLMVPAITGEVIVRKQYEAHLGFGNYYTASSSHYNGAEMNLTDNSSYACRLQVAQALNVTAIDIGGGYRFQLPYVKNFSLHVGLMVYEPELKVQSTFYDSLYDREVSGSATYRGTAAAPYLAVGYTWPALKWLDIGAKIRYRYQYGTCGLGIDSPVPEQNPAGAALTPLSCNFGGLDGSVFINVHLSFTRSE